MEIGPVRGVLPFDFELDRLVLGDENGPWLTMSGLHLNWSPRELLRGRIYVRELSTRQVHLERLPLRKEKKEKGPFRLPEWALTFERLKAERLAVDRLSLGKSVLGQEASFRGEANLMAALPGGEWVTALNVERTDGSKFKLSLNGTVREKGPYLILDAKGEEDPGGLLASRLGIVGPLTFSLRGEGPLEGWKGKTEVLAGKENRLQADIGLALLEELRLNAEGSVAAEPELLPEPIGVWLGSSNRFVLMGRAAKGGVFALDRLFLDTGKVSLDLSGDSDLKGQGMKGRFQIQCKDLEPLGRTLKVPVAGSVKVKGDLSGTFSRPVISLTFGSEDLAVDEVRATHLSGGVNLELSDAERLGDAPFLRVAAKGEMAGLRLPPSVPLPERDLRWEFTVERASKGMVRVEDLTLGGEKVFLRVSGTADTTAQRGKFRVEAEGKDWRDFIRRQRGNFAGSIHLRAEVEGNLQEESFSADMQGRVGLRNEGRGTVAFPVKGVDYQGRVSLNQGRKLTVAQMRLSSALGDLSGKGVLDLSTGQWNGTAEVALSDLQPLSALAGVTLTGSARAKTSIRGSPAGVSLDSEVRGEEVHVAGLSLGRASVDLSVEGFSPAPGGAFHFRVREEAEGISGKARFALIGDQLSFSGVDLSGPGSSHARGDLGIGLSNGLMEGEVVARCPELSFLSVLVGREMQGKAEIKATLARGETGQQARFTLLGHQLNSPPIGSASELRLQGALRDMGGKPEGTATAELKDFRRQGVHVSSMNIRAEGGVSRISFSGMAKGEAGWPFDLEAEGLFYPNQQSSFLRVDALKGHYGAVPVWLAEAAELERAKKGLSLPKAEFVVADGRLWGSGRLGPEDVDLSVKLEDLSLNPTLRPVGFPSLEGRARVELHVKGPIEKIQGTSRVRIQGLKVSDPHLDDVPRATLEAQASLQGERLQGEVALHGLTSMPITVSGYVPFSLSLKPFSVVLPPDGKAKGRLNGEADLASLGRFMGLHDQAFGGKAVISLNMEGTVRQPSITGGLEVEKGVYENIRTGTILKDIQMKMAAQMPRLLLQEARASDGAAGTVTGEGWMDMNLEQGLPLHTTFLFKNAVLVRHDLATGKVSGRLGLEGSTRRPKLVGEIQVESAELHIPKYLASDVPELEVVEIHGPGGDSGKGAALKRAAGPGMVLDLAVKSPGRIMLRGRGLDSEWGADLRIRGTAAEPIITGDLSVVRGRFNFLDKRFNLEGGRISFNGTRPPSPFLDAKAVASAKDITVHLGLLGPVRAPEIKLSSDPPYPSDEVLSRLLFGRSVSTISPLQAIQLGQALNQMGGEETLDLLGQTRQLLKIDQLEVKQTGEGIDETSIAAGKYLVDNLYLEIEKELGPKGPKASLDWEVTPNISIETEVGSNEEAGIGINWKWDY